MSGLRGLDVTIIVPSYRRELRGGAGRGGQPGDLAPAPAAGRVPPRGQLQRPPGLQAGRGRELHLLQVGRNLKF